MVRLPLLVALLASIGCATPTTEVIVRVDTDVPADVPLTLRATVTRATGTGAATQQVSQRGSLDGGVVFPATFAVTPGSSYPDDGTVTLVLEADLPL